MTKNHQKRGSGTHLAEHPKKNYLFHGFWVGSNLENGAGVQVLTRFTRNHTRQKKLEKGLRGPSFLDAFGPQIKKKTIFGAP